MAHRGAKPTLKAIEGGLQGVPPMPAMLPDSLHDEWRTIATDLRDRRLLTMPMLGTLETYLRALWSGRLAQKAIEEHGLVVTTERGSPKANPAATTLHESQMAVARLAAELGITPASRSRKAMGGTDPGPDDNDALGL